MRYTTTSLAVAILTTVLLAPQAFAASKASKEESIGVGSGAVVGAVAGGPVGFIIGAAIGAKIGDTIGRKNEQLENLEGALDESTHTVATLQGDIGKLGGEIEQLRDVARPELVSLLQAGIAMDLLFRTDEFALADTTGDRLAGLAGTLATMADIRIQLDGFADERGDETYNFELSEKRVDFVREQFIAAGVHPNRISVSAHGESAAQDATTDNFALERRVSVKLFIDDSPSLASNPN
ncbi:MAG: OmpA family protein [Gammaproteobacteria bacterium]|nr:OmpA family protein [Gammaproteobacteria bacterium]NNL49678.1 OmpA family protein [Woeseiaceae bacterium]